mmetsp:Transcript_31587/g.82587  ORF Transcript_31587/g.82587 Transcript_31587/m.82587 type:complete len:87 (-) Transcript_31587:940-1200(-)
MQPCKPPAHIVHTRRWRIAVASTPLSAAIGASRPRWLIVTTAPALPTLPPTREEPPPWLAPAATVLVVIPLALVVFFFFVVIVIPR